MNCTNSAKESGQAIQPELYQKLADGYQKHLDEVQLAKGHLTKYWWGCMYTYDHVLTALVNPCDCFFKVIKDLSFSITPLTEDKS